MDRCPECAFPMPYHFEHEGENEGAYIGCPRRIALSDRSRLQPIVMLRVHRRDGRRFAIWVDCILPADEAHAECKHPIDHERLLVWDLRSGEQSWIGRARLRDTTRKPSLSEQAEMHADVEMELKQKVRIARGAQWARQSSQDAPGN